jgi:hypothetical protein
MAMLTAERAVMVANLREALETLPAVLLALPLTRLDAAPAPGAWSARDVLGHLADAEQVYGVRLRMLVTQPRPFLASYDQNAWARRFAHLESVESALERWTVLRRANLAVIEALSEDEWLRSGDHEEGMQVGRVETPERVADVLVRHTREHLIQMLAAVGDGR